MALAVAPIDSAWPASVELARDVAAAVAEIAAMMPPDRGAVHVAAAAAMVVEVETAWTQTQARRWIAEADRARADARAARGGMSVYEAERIRRGED